MRHAGPLLAPMLLLTIMLSLAPSITLVHSQGITIGVYVNFEKDTCRAGDTTCMKIEIINYSNYINLFLTAVKVEIKGIGTFTKSGIAHLRPYKKVVWKLCITIPEDVRPGVYNAIPVSIDLRADVPEGLVPLQPYIDYTLSPMGDYIRILPPPPKPRIYLAASIPRNIAVGEEYTLEITVSNKGNLPGNDTAVKVLMDGNVIYEEVVGVIGINESKIVRIPVKIPIDTNPGKHTIEIIASCDGGKYGARTSLEVNVLAPVLLANSIATTDMGSFVPKQTIVVEQGKEIEFKLSINNKGNAELKDTAITISIDGLKPLKKIIGSIPPATGKEAKIVYKIPGELSPGEYNCTIIISASNAVSQKIQYNISVKSPFEITMAKVKKGLTDFMNFVTAGGWLTIIVLVIIFYVVYRIIKGIIVHIAGRI